jgi:hypothetical protein
MRFRPLLIETIFMPRKPAVTFRVQIEFYIAKSHYNQDLVFEVSFPFANRSQYLAILRPRYDVLPLHSRYAV